MPDAISRLSAALEGRYRVERVLGQGGMATVYLAEDLRHARRVALKVLRPELAAAIGTERFLAEIRTTAALQHPHILPLHESGEAGGLLFYVMPAVEGESLRDRLDREHQLSVDEAVRIATDVAEALEYAHRRGVIHRDIKPSNILLLDGEPVIADFGIALARTSGGASRLTETGLSLGTPHYMSPEQATGDQAVGPASDVWSLGCVLYEMLLGEPPHTGSTPQAVLAKVITAEAPSVSAGRPSVPPNVDAAIRKALERVPADRFQRAADLASALRAPSFGYGAARTASAAPRGPWNRVSVGLAALAGLLAVGLLWTASDSSRAPPGAPARFDVTPAEGQRLPLVPGVDFALSPDGRTLVFVGIAESGASQLWRRSIEDLDAVRIPGTEGALHPSISPDGRSVAYGSGGEIRTIALEGGPSVTVTTGGQPAWGSDGMIYFSRGDIIWRVPTGGGEPEPVTAPTEGRAQRFPSLLPDRRGILLSLLTPSPVPAESRIAVVGPEGGAPREILEGAMARYSPTGHVLYSTADGTVMAAPFDVRRLEVTGPSVALIEGVVVKGGSATQLALSPSGTLLYGVGPSTLWELVWVSRAGEATPVDPDWAADFAFPTLSPDGTRLAVSIRTPESRDIWVKRLDRGPALRLTLGATYNDQAAWSPDGASVSYFSNQAGSTFDLWSKRADGSGQPSLLLDRESVLMEPLWSPNSEWLVYSSAVANNGDLEATRSDGTGTPLPVAATSAAERAPTFSPDGRYVAYSSNEAGLHEVYVVPFPDAGTTKWAVSAGGGSEPVWSRASGEIFYRNLRGEMVTVSVSTSPTFSAGTPTVLFDASGYRAFLNHRHYDVTPDGERFIMLRPLGEQGAQWILALNFFEVLRERVPD